MPESESLRRRFEEDLRMGLRRLTHVGIVIDCGGTSHRVMLEGIDLRVADHDGEAEAVLGAVGGPAPACLEVVAAVADAGPPQLWAALTSRAGSSLGRIPGQDLRVLLARSLRDEFDDASPVVRDSVARLGRSLLSADFRMTPAIATKFQMTREFPKWDTGLVPWSDRDLVFLARAMRMSRGEPAPTSRSCPPIRPLDGPSPPI